MLPSISKFFHLPSFIIGLSFGLFIIYIQTPDLTTIFVYPNPDNEDKIIYKDRSDNCYQFTSKEISCPKDTSKIREYPVQ